MSNHLQRLIARSRGELALVQPRMQGRFEPIDGSSHAPLEHALETTLTALAPRPHGEDPAAAMRATLRRFAPAASRAPVMDIEDLIGATPSAASHAPRPRSNATGATNVDALPRSTAAPAGRADDAAQPEPVAPNDARPAVSLRPFAASASTAASAHRASEQHDTVVQVTIGRVDVRAVAPPAARAPPRAEPPRRSLDDYLRGTRR